MRCLGVFYSKGGAATLLAVVGLACTTPPEDDKSPVAVDTGAEVGDPDVNDEGDEGDELSFLLELVETDREILLALQEEIGFGDIDLREVIAPGETEEFWSGEVAGTELDGVAGVTRIIGAASFYHQDETFSDVTWTLEVEVAALEVGDRSLGGLLTLDAHDQRFEGSIEDQDVTATLTWDGETHDVSYTARYSWWELAKVDGTVDDEGLEWETDEIDEP